MKKTLAVFIGIIVAIFLLCFLTAGRYTKENLNAAYREGHEEGYEEGYRRGRAVGWDEGYNECYAEGGSDVISYNALEDIYYELDNALENVNRVEGALDDCLYFTNKEGISIATYIREYFSEEAWCHGSDDELVDNFISYLYSKLEDATYQINKSNEEIWYRLNR